ncbi:MAG: hypothetical protein H6725_18775 [Sandaracinaceae bacterium]|nr:hypothetical protein [Sandaracinaceae bacterium]
MTRLLRSRLLVLASLGSALLYAGCGEEDPAPNDGGTDNGTGMDGSVVDQGTGGPTWTVRTHPCPGINRTDAFHVDTDGTMWLGCGSGADGNGLFRSADGGMTWAIPATNPTNVLTSFRVHAVHRGYGGLIYVAGRGTGGSMVLSLDTSTTPFTATAVLTAGTSVDTSFTASPFVTTGGGAAFADSFNGHGALYRPDDTVADGGALWTDAQDWESDGGTSHQILDLVALGERFVGCGSTIAEAPFVFLPSPEVDAEMWEMTPIALVSGLGAYTGEMWGVAADSSRVVVVGVDQTNHIGKIFVSGTDRYLATDYTQHDIDPLLSNVSASDSTWARGVCMASNRVVVVGEVQPLGAGDNSGFVLESTDGGVTFTDITPSGSPDTWSKCTIDAGGRILVAGAGAVATLE